MSPFKFCDHLVEEEREGYAILHAFNQRTAINMTCVVGMLISVWNQGIDHLQLSDCVVS